VRIDRSGVDVRSRKIVTHQDRVVDPEPDMTLEEIRSQVLAGQCFKASVSVVWRFWLAHGVAASGITAYLNTGGHARRGGADFDLTEEGMPTKIIDDGSTRFPRRLAFRNSHR
jgi:hypothetical protein